MSIRSLRRNGCLPIAVAIVLTVFGNPASAQVSQSPSTDSASPAPTSSQASSGGEGGGLEEIVVTAEHREENLQRTPIAVSAFTGADLQKQQIVDVASLTNVVPNVEFTQQQSTNGIFIRGIGLDSAALGSDPRVAIYTDGVYNARVTAALGSFFDIDQIEVLRGPQGTLYGRNATAGAININSRDPGDSLNGYGTVTVGDYDLVRFEGAVGGPLSSTVSGRIAVMSVDRGGYGRDIGYGQNDQTSSPIDDDHERAVRGKLKYEPNSEFNLMLEAYYRDENDHNGQYVFIQNKPGVTPAVETFGLGYYYPPAGSRDSAGQQPVTLIEGHGVSATANLHLGDAVLTSVTGYQHAQSSFFSAADPSTCGCVPVDYAERSDSVSEELRLTDTFGPVKILVGTYYFHENNSDYTTAELNGLFFGLTDALYQGSDFGGIETTNAWAGFANATVSFTDKLGLDVGIRYSDESRGLIEYDQVDLTRIYKPSNPILVPGLYGSDQQAHTWTAADPKATIHYDFTDDIMAYATYAVGFKSGGFNIGGLQPPFSPETLYDYEGGIKAQFFDHRLRANIAAFYYNYKNLQVNIVDNTQFITTNAAKARIYGMEGEFTAIPVDDLHLTVDLSWLHSEYLEYNAEDPGRPELGVLNLSGNQLDFSPKYRVSTEAGYTFHSHIGDITPRARVTWTDRVYFSPFDLPYVGQPAYALGDIFLDYLPGDGKSGWSASLYVKNVTNKYYLVEGVFNSTFEGYPITGLNGPPRTVGLSVSKRF
jgi:iron complex outermembrane receptor protein